METGIIILRWIGWVIYFLSFIFYIRYFQEQRKDLAKPATFFLIAGVFVQAIALLLQWEMEGHFPIVSVGEATFTWMFFFGLLYLILEIRLREQAFGVFIVGLMVTFIMISNLLPLHHGPLPTFFQDKTIQVHILLMLFSYTGFTIGFIASVMYLLLLKELREKNLGYFYSRLPALELLDKLSLESIYIGFIFLTVGILIALSLGSKYLTHAWYLDSKIVSVFITWIIYAVYLGTRWFLNWQPRKCAYISITGFSWIIVSFMIMTTLFSKVHAY
ncbi:MAG: cytochrome c biogenesis protein CcsA [Calditrichaeota bacterium]|nr:cytochrome c biogenesis protein CcsA [Calditrichota bacterium]